MSESSYLTARPSQRERLAYDLRIVHVLARSEFRLKYAGSVLGYVWSLAKPLAYFTVLLARLREPLQVRVVERYPLYLLIGIVLNTFVVDAVTATLPSIVSSGPTIRRIAFPPIVVPLATTLAAAMTFLANCVVVAIFLGFSHVRPDLDWLLLVPLMVELYVFVVAIALVASTLYVRFRDIGQIWEVTTALLFFVAPIMYPITILSPRVQHLVELNPFVQVMQDVRTILLGSDAAKDGVGPLVDGRVFPIAIALALLAAALWLYRRESPRFAERA